MSPLGTWSNQAVTSPTVIFDGRLYWMWFTGVERDRPGESAYLFRTFIGAAISIDGLSWTPLNGGQPVFMHGLPGSFDQHSVGHPMVIRDRDRFLMWYGGADGTDATADIRIERIGLAQSVDGVNWTRLNGGAPVVDIGGASSPDSIQATGPTVVRTIDGYTMWYGAYNGTHTIMAARSTDGVTWTKVPLSGLPPDALGPSVTLAGGAFHMFYSQPLAGRWTMVAATSPDGLSWTPVSGSAAILGGAPAANFDAGGAGQNHSVHPSQLLVEGSRIRVWYAGEEPDAPFHQRIGLMEATVPHLATRSDFSGDGRPDLLWHDLATGDLLAWTMNGRTLASSQPLGPGRIREPHWRIVGTGDANGDGQADIFWQEQTEGWLAVWLMDGRTLLASELLQPSRVADTNWKVVAVADMNSDGKPDVVWREETEGWVGVWLMNGLHAAASLAVSPERVGDVRWTIAGAGDFNYDGKQDLLWQHRSEGWLAVWFLDGVNMTDSLLLSPTAVRDTRWRIAAVSDTNDDGRADLIWREEESGWLVSWEMHGTALVTSASLTPDRTSVNWKLVGPK